MNIKEQSQKIIIELLEICNLKKDDIFVVGCSSSEVCGERIGTSSSIETAKQIFDGIYPVLKEKDIYLAVQCCEHLNRAIIIENECAKKYNLEIVNVMPQIKAGGSMATTAFMEFKEPVAVEHIKANAGIDIGGTLIGMHLKDVAVPVRISVNKLGNANIICARTRPKFIGGERAFYQDNLK